jgi:hypothetical protein
MQADRDEAARFASFRLQQVGSSSTTGAAGAVLTAHEYEYPISCACSRMVECPLNPVDSRITEKLFWDTAEAQTAPPGTSPPPVLLARMRPAHGADVPPAPRSSAARTLARQWPYITGSGVEGVAWRGDRRWRARGDVDGAERQMRPSCARWPTDTQRHSCTREP